MAVYLTTGRIKYRAHGLEGLEGLESAIEGINPLFSGEKRGKLMVKL